ncbi:MAG: hypothetical protein NXY57DRAFT_966633 [Lentinula lateritia]|nr:MAG: hypothetical protein NXY57DRAFT_966633 [Lentinula lateritia]
MLLVHLPHLRIPPDSDVDEIASRLHAISWMIHCGPSWLPWVCHVPPAFGVKKKVVAQLFLILLGVATAMIKSHLSLIASWRSTEIWSTNSTSALLKLNPLDDQDQRELDRQELWEFCQHQPLVLGPPPLVPHSSSLADNPVDRSSPIAPTVPQVEGGSDYRRVVLIPHPPHIPGLELPTLPEGGHLQSRSQGYTEIPHRIPQAGSFEQFVPPSKVEDFSRSRIKNPPVQQRSWEPLCPYPHSQASSALRVENDHLKTEVEELRTLLAQSRGQVSTLTSLLCDTSSSLDLRSQELEASCQSLEEVAEDRAEYQQVLSQFRAIKDLLTHFHIAHSEVDAYREVAKHQKQELMELRKQVDDTTSHFSNAYAELDSTNAHALRQ